MIPIILFDLDGVLRDFVRGALKFHKREDVPYSQIRWSFDKDLGIQNFWDELGFDFWSGLQPHPEGMKLLENVQKAVPVENLGILTSPADTKGAVEGTRAWVKTWLPHLFSNLIVTRAKGLVAAKNKILIDDHDGNIEKFQMFGGKTVLTPRYWNSRHSEVEATEGAFHPGRLFGEVMNKMEEVKRGA